MAPSARKVLTRSSGGTGVIIALSAIVVMLPLTILELVMLVIGAGACVVVQRGGKKRVSKQCGRKVTAPCVDLASPQHATVQEWTTSDMPVPLRSFNKDDWEVQVAELLQRITPSPQSNHVVKALTESAQRVVRTISPTARVLGFACSDVARRGAFSVAVPEVELVVQVSSQQLVVERSTSSNPDMFKLQKTLLRVCTDKVCADAGFRFRRTALTSQEPKVTLLAPLHVTNTEEAVPLNLSINANIPVRNAQLLDIVGRARPCGRDLILLVRRWAKDRAVCFAPKGHLSLYAWGILATSFLQGHSTTLPPLDQLEHQATCDLPESRRCSTTDQPCELLGALFKGFFKAFHDFAWATEVVCVRSGKKGVRTQSALGGPDPAKAYIVDPFESSENLGSCLTEASFMRLQEELSRGYRLCSSGSALSELFEPFTIVESGR